MQQENKGIIRTWLFYTPIDHMCNSFWFTKISCTKDPWRWPPFNKTLLAPKWIRVYAARIISSKFLIFFLELWLFLFLLVFSFIILNFFNRESLFDFGSLFVSLSAEISIRQGWPIHVWIIISRIVKHAIFFWLFAWLDFVIRVTEETASLKFIVLHFK